MKVPIYIQGERSYKVEVLKKESVVIIHLGSYPIAAKTKIKDIDLHKIIYDMNKKQKLEIREIIKILEEEKLIEEINYTNLYF